MKKKEFWIVVAISLIILAFAFLIVYVGNQVETKAMNYGCAYGCYYGLGKDEVPLNFSFDNNQMICILKCVQEYEEVIR